MKLESPGWVAALCALVWSVTAAAQMTGPAPNTPSHAPPNTAHTKRIAGTVARVDGTELLLTVAGGTTETYQLSPAVRLRAAHKATLAALATGRAVECISIYSHVDEVLAGECQLLAAGMQPAAVTVGEADSSTPTISGTITQLNVKPNPRPGTRPSLLVGISTPDGTKTMTVSPLTRIFIVGPGDAADLTRGATVRGISQQAADGTGVIQELTILTRRVRLQ